MIEKVIQAINELLKKANFETFVLENFSTQKTKFCFDLLVKKDNSIFSVKVFHNIDNLNPSIINDIKTLSILLQSKPLLIGIRNRYEKLQENTIYMREGLPFFSLKTLENIIKYSQFPYILARRGGGVIFLNGSMMKTLRESKSLSRKELSEKLGVTKRTICAYENDSMRPSEKIAMKLFEIFGESSIFRKMNPFDWKIKFNMEESNKLEESELTPFESHVQEVMNDIGISTYWYDWGPIPFKLSLYTRLNDSSDIFPVFSGISERQKKLIELNIKCLRMFTELFNKHSIFIVNNNIKISENLKNDQIPIVKVKELENVDDEEEFVELVQGTQSNE